MKRKALSIILIVSLMLSLVSCNTSNKVSKTPEESTNQETAKKEEDKKNTESETSDKDKTLDKDETVKEQADEKVEVTLDKLIPKTDLELSFKGTDFASNKNNIKVSGKTYQVIETTGKGPKVTVYTIKEGGLCKVYSGDLTEEESKDISKVNYLEKYKENNKTILLKEPLKLKTRWDNKEIVAVGKNLKLNDLQLEGAYVKVWEKSVEGENKTVKVTYYSEGLGCVMYKVMLNDAVVEESVLASVVKR